MLTQTSAGKQESSVLFLQPLACVQSLMSPFPPDSACSVQQCSVSAEPWTAFFGQLRLAPLMPAKIPAPRFSTGTSLSWCLCLDKLELSKQPPKQI